MYTLVHKQHPKVMSLLCYTITAVFSFMGCAHKPPNQYVIQRDLNWLLKGAVYPISGYTVYSLVHCVPWHSHCTPQPDKIPLDHILIWMFVCAAQKNGCDCVTEEAHRFGVLFVHQYVRILGVMWSFNNLSLLTFMTEVRGGWHLRYLLDWQNFVDKLLDDSTLVPKCVGVGTWYDVCFIIYFTANELVDFAGF